MALCTTTACHSRESRMGISESLRKSWRRLCNAVHSCASLATTAQIYQAIANISDHFNIFEPFCASLNCVSWSNRRGRFDSLGLLGFLAGEPGHQHHGGHFWSHDQGTKELMPHVVIHLQPDDVRRIVLSDLQSTKVSLGPVRPRPFA